MTNTTFKGTSATSGGFVLLLPFVPSKDLWAGEPRMTTATLDERPALAEFEDFYRRNWHAATRLAASVAGN